MPQSFCTVFFVLMLATAPALAHEGHTHRYMGTIAAVNASQLELKTTAGKTMVFKLDDSTRITRGPEKGSKDDLKIGIRAVVEAEGAAEPATAKTIKLSTPDRSKAS